MSNHKKFNGINGPSILDNTEEYIEEIVLDIPDKKPIIAKFNIPATPTLEHELKAWEKINNFEKRSWDTQKKGLTTGFKSIDKAFEGGLVPAFYIIAADSNIGKTAVMSQIAVQVAKLNKSAYVMDFSLDDPLPDKMSRIVGSNSKVLINAVKNPLNYLHMPDMLARRKEGLNKIRRMVSNYMPYDANDTTFIEDIEQYVTKMMIDLEILGEKRQLSVFIDNLHDLNIRDKPNLQDKAKYDYIAQWAADLSIKFDIIVICTAELKKLNSTRRPALDDIRESTKIKYEAKAIILVYNEVHYKGVEAEVYYNRSDLKEKQPVLELHFAKNKVSSFKGRLFFEFIPEMAHLIESSEKASKSYLNSIYSS